MKEQEFNNWCELELILSNVCAALRNKFKELWSNVSMTPWNSPSEVLYQEMTRKMFGGATRSLIKNLYKNKNVNDWDITTLANAFYCLDLYQDVDDRSRFLSRLERIISIRNRNAHSSSKCLSAKELEESWRDVNITLLQLGFSENEVDDIRNSKTYNNIEQLSASVQSASQLKTRGNALVEQNSYTAAISLYSEAIVLPNLPDFDLAILYANRSHCYLETRKPEMALEDAKNAKRLRDDWWKPYYRIGQAYVQLGNLDKAIRSFDKALVRDVENPRVIDARADARIRKGEEERNEHLSGESFTEALTSNMTEDEIELFKRLAIKQDPSYKDVLKGHEHRDKEEYKKAAKYYSSAMRKGNAEAIYNLALLTKAGKGVARDYTMAFALLKLAASKDPFTEDGSPVVGVAEAEHTIGLAYEEGTLVEKSPYNAIEWYERAVSHKLGRSANNLGLIYLNGNGVNKDLKKAEQLFLFAINHHDNAAVDNMTLLYLTMGNVDKAIEWNKRSMLEGSVFAFANQTMLEEHLKRMGYSSIADWEQKDPMKTKDKTGNLYGQLENLSGNLRNILSGPTSPTTFSGGENFKYRYDMDILEKLKDQSPTAAKIYTAAAHFAWALHALTIGNDEDFVTNLAACGRIDETTAVYLPAFKPPILRMMKSDNTLLDRDARMCYAQMNCGVDLEGTIEFVSESIKKYPDDVDFWHLRGDLNSFVPNFESGLRDLNHALQLTPNDYRIMYGKAATTRLLMSETQSGIQKAIDEYQNFIRLAPKDERKYPEGYYAIGVLELGRKKQNLEEVKRYYKLGLEAEKDQLPFFLPYESTSKKVLELFLSSNSLLAPQPSIPTNLAKLEDPLRKELILDHRRYFNAIKQAKFMTTLPNIQNSRRPVKTRNTNSNSLTGKEKEIFLNDINFSKDKILEGTMLNLKIIEQVVIPLSENAAMVSVVEDANENVQRISFYNCQHLPLDVGTKISITNPYARVAQDGKPVIRIDDPSSVNILSNVTNICYVCSKPDAKKQCAKCKRARYCSRDCQVLDWKEFQHKLVCD